MKYICLCILLLLTAGCGTKTASSKDNTSAQSPEFVRGYNISLNGEILPGNNGDTLYRIHNQTISYLDIESPEQDILLCSQTGCEHKDESCAAYIGNAEYFLAYKNIWYTLVQESDTSVILKSYDYANNTRKEIAVYQTDPGSDLEVNSICADHDFLYVSLREFTESEDRNEIIVKDYTVKTDLSGKNSEIVLGPHNPSGQFIGCHKDLMIYEDVRLKESAVDLDTWISEGKNAEEYPDYIDAMTIHELHRKDLSAGEDICICDYPGNTSVYSVNERYFVYNDTKHVYIYNFETGETLQTADDRIINTELFDGHVFYITRKEDNSVNLYSFPLNSINSVSCLTENSSSPVVPFSLIFETETGFFGLSDSSFCWIRKDDFYCSQYDKAIVLKEL